MWEYLKYEIHLFKKRTLEIGCSLVKNISVEIFPAFVGRPELSGLSFKKLLFSLYF
jgi:hypothetical protein